MYLTSLYRTVPYVDGCGPPGSEIAPLAAPRPRPRPDGELGKQVGVSPEGERTPFHHPPPLLLPSHSALSQLHQTASPPHRCPSPPSRPPPSGCQHRICRTLRFVAVDPDTPLLRRGSISLCEHEGCPPKLLPTASNFLEPTLPSRAFLLPCPRRRETRPNVLKEGQVDKLYMAR